MRIAVNTDNYEILNSVIRKAKEKGDTVVITKLEKSLFNKINTIEEDEVIDAYILSNITTYCQKAIDFIKKEFPYAPIVIIAKDNKIGIKGADSIIPFEPGNDTDIFAESAIYNIHVYFKNFETLQRLTANLKELIEFGNCSYDPSKRILFKDGVQVQKLSPKQAGIFELLAANFGTVIKREIIMEKVWHQSNYFIGRSLDVFVTHLRKILEQKNIKMSITNISNVGLMLDHMSEKK